MSTSNPPNQIAEAGAAIPAYLVVGGSAVSSGNPLPTLGSGGSLSDVLLTDSTGALFIARDTGTTITYHNMNTNAAYTPVGTIQVADTLAQGTDNTGVSQLNTGTGVRGWLSGVYSKLSSSLPVTVATGGSSVVTGQAVLASAGTAQQIAANALVNGLVITAPLTNTGTITLGGSTVTNVINGTGNGYPLAPGQSFSFSVSNSNGIWFNGTVTGDEISFGGN